eukprot:jgi/Hompol1/112/HPOL_002442-RA
MDLLPIIFHEKQEGQLCAQHCLNALLQGPYFTAVDLSQLGMELDEAEAMAMAEGNTDGIESDDFRKFKRGGSTNFDDSGFFSVQVIEKALAVWALGIRPIRSKDSAHALQDPSAQSAFICNLDQHWFTLRRFGASPKRWYNLNSVFPQPEYVSEMYLGMLISQLQAEGYSIFVVNGDLPSCDADQYARQVPQPPESALPRSGSKAAASTTDQPPESRTLKPFSGTGMTLGSLNAKPGSSAVDMEEMARTLAASFATKFGRPQDGNLGSSEEDLQLAIAASLSEHESNDKTLQKVLQESMQLSSVVAHPSNQDPSGSAVGTQIHPGTDTTERLSEQEIMRRKRLERFGKPQ